MCKSHLKKLHSMYNAGTETKSYHWLHTQDKIISHGHADCNN